MNCRNESISDGFFCNLLGIERKGLIAVLQVYCDESERDYGIFCIAGFAFAARQVKKFNKKWLRLFAGYPGGLHMRDLAQRTRAFRGIDKKEQERLIVEAVKIIRDHVSAGFTVSCNVNEVQSLAPTWIRGYGHAYPICCHLVMTRVGKFLEDSGSSERVIYIFEAGHRREAEARDFLRNMVQNSDGKQSYRHSGDAFLPKSDAVPLQAADMLAWEWAKFVDETVERNIRPIRKSLLALFKHDTKRYAMSHVTGESLAKFLSDIWKLGLLELQERADAAAAIRS